MEQISLRNAQDQHSWLWVPWLQTAKTVMCDAQSMNGLSLPFF